MKKVFIDTDIILDLLAERKPFHDSAAELFSIIDSGEIKGYTSAVIIANINYILTKMSDKNKAKNNTIKILTLLNVLSVNEKIIKLGLASDFKDFEDSLQYYTAVENKIEFLITRNVDDFKTAEITILTAEEYLNIYSRK